MRARLPWILAKFADLGNREQLLVLVAVFAVAYQVADLVVWDRQFRQVETLNREIAKDNAAIHNLNTELGLLTTRAQHDPNEALREQIGETRGRVAELQKQLRSATGGMISPQDMARFLERLLVQEDALTMLSLKTLDTRTLVDSDKSKSREIQSLPVLHRHGFEIAFSGGYLSTLRYLKALEDLPWQFFWDSVSYEVIEYPQSVVRLQLHTLSLSEDWIGV